MYDNAGLCFCKIHDYLTWDKFFHTTKLVPVNVAGHGEYQSNNNLFFDNIFWVSIFALIKKLLMVKQLYGLNALTQRHVY